MQYCLLPQPPTSAANLISAMRSGSYNRTCLSHLSSPLLLGLGGGLSYNRPSASQVGEPLWRTFHLPRPPEEKRAILLPACLTPPAYWTDIKSWGGEEPECTGGKAG